MSAPKPKPPLDGDKFTRRLRELATQDRSPRCIDVLLVHQAEIVTALKSGVHAKEVYQALTESGFKISYAGFMRSLIGFREAVQLPSRRDLIRQQRLLARRNPGNVLPIGAPAARPTTTPATAPTPVSAAAKSRAGQLLGPGIKGVVAT